MKKIITTASVILALTAVSPKKAEAGMVEGALIGAAIGAIIGIMFELMTDDDEEKKETEELSSVKNLSIQS